MSQCTICRKDETVHTELQWKTHQKQVQELVPTYDLTVIKERILARRRVLENIRGNQPMSKKSNGVTSDRYEDWMYVTECALCNAKRLIRIDFPVCHNCRSDLGAENCRQIL
jgi:hypothetical protein